MWSPLLFACFISHALTKHLPKSNTSMFRDEQIIFTSGYTITKLLVPADGTKQMQTELSDIPTIFFTISDTKLEGGSCIYVLEGLAAYEILEGGRDSTADYGLDTAIYFGGRDGLYKYHADTLSAKRYGNFKEDIIQLQKGNGFDAIYILNTEHKLYKIEKNGTVKSRVRSVTCALEFVLDTSNNIYYIACDDRMPHIIKSDGSILSLTASVLEDFKEIQLLRPAFIMEHCIPFFGDGGLYLLYSNGTTDKKDFVIKERPTAYSVDAALYLVAALNGRIYEYNLMEVLLKSMFGVATGWPRDLTNLIMSIIDSSKDNFFGLPRLTVL